MMKKTGALFFLILMVATAWAQSRSTLLTIEVQSVEGDHLAGQTVQLMQTDFEVSYGALVLDGNGQCQVKVYAGNHNLTIEREGFETLSHDFIVADGQKELTVSVTLREKTRAPYALSATVEHNSYTGKDDILLTWNTEQPAFFDDFESYEPFAVQFGEWTGIDADMEAAAPLVGNYPNRGVMQYAQIINPLTVEPMWWYDYPILRPYDGQQYVGFTRTSSGLANDDWLITPVILVGTDNIFSFMAKAADQYPERFMVYVTTQTDNPVQTDFVRIDPDNYETADYRGWKEYTYDLSDYAGQQVRLAIRYISDYNRYRSFMLMVDDVYVGSTIGVDGDYSAYSNYRNYRKNSHPKCHRSPANPNEQFRIYYDGLLAGTTDGYSYTLADVQSGPHTIGVQAVYIAGESEVTTIDVVVPESNYAHVVFQVEADSKLNPDGTQIDLIGIDNGESHTLIVADGKAEIASLPCGRYAVNVAEGAYEAWQQTIDISEDMTVVISLTDHIIDPYNITAVIDDDLNLIIRWNQELGITDSFEDYDDFATGSFGEWTTIDRDKMCVYPIALGTETNIISFPGSGTAAAPKAIAPMVFNPWQTTPPMMPDDNAIAAPTGQKTVIFFSPQMSLADKWLISPLYDIYPGFALSVTAKGYTSLYPERIEFCVSAGSDQPDDFEVISKVETLSSDQWTIYQTDLDAYAGQTVRLAVHYTSWDAFLAQVDDFTVGPKDGESAFNDYGNVEYYEVWVDGVLAGQTTEPTFVMPDIEEGHHVIGVKAVYQSGQSQLVEYVIGDTVGLVKTLATGLSSQPSQPIYDLQGRRLSGMPSKGFYIKDHRKIVR